MLGQLAGDSLGSLVEFQTADQIWRAYPKGVRELVDGGTWNTLAGQPTDDSELALMLARSLVEHGRYDRYKVKAAYRAWYDSGPFDCGGTIASALRDMPNEDSQANGALMRCSPLGIFGAGHDLWDVAKWATQDAGLTHPHPVCRQANALFTMAVAQAIRTGCSARSLYAGMLVWAEELNVEPSLRGALLQAALAPPQNYIRHQGWVLIAFQNAIWQMLHAPNLEEGVVDSVMHGGDTDTNAAICGALLGAIHGESAIPAQWKEKVLNCRPERGKPAINRPRPEVFWPVDALDLAARLVSDADPDDNP
jgi:ADP-ribosylglycohydrolase